MAVNSKRIIKNTGWLYLRMILILIVSLYTSRVILNALGVVDFGIYNVVGGVVGLLGFLKSSLSGATSRFLAFELGRKDDIRLKQTFEASFLVHVALSFLVVFLLETVGLWFVQNKLEIPQERHSVALIVYHFSVLASVLNIMQVPYNSCVIAREKMDFFAMIGVIDAGLKLAIAYCINQDTYDKLSFYGSLVAIESFVILILYYIYCKRQFKECTISLSVGKNVVKPLLSFTGWDLYGNLSVVVRSQGLNILQNTFFGPVVNASTGIANQVMAGIMGFADNFLTAVKPQIIKLYAERQIKSLISLVNASSKLSFLLLLLISAPLMTETEYILKLWLVQVPAWAVAFCQLSIINNWVSIIFRPIVYAIHATGNAKRISLINGTIYILVLPLSYVFLKYGASPEVPFILNIVLLFIGHALFSMLTLKHYIREYPILSFFRTAVIPSVIISVASFIPSYFIKLTLDQSFSRFVVNSICTSLIVLITGWMIMLKKDERVSAITLIRSKLH